MEGIIIMLCFSVSISFLNCSKHLLNINWLILHPFLGQRLAFNSPLCIQYQTKISNTAPNLEFEAQIYGV